MQNEYLDKELKKAVIRVCYLFIIVGTVYALYTLRSILSLMVNIAAPFAVGFIVAYLFDPVVTFIQHRLHLSRIVGLVVVYLIIILIVVLFLFWLLPVMYQQLLALVRFMVNVLPGKIEQLIESFQGKLKPEQQEYLQKQLHAAQRNVKEILAASLPGLKSVANGGVSAAGAMAEGVVKALNIIMAFFSFLAFVVIVSFYLIVDFNKIRPAIEPLVPPKHRERFFNIVKKVDTAVGGFIRGQLIDCAMVGVLTAICLFIAGFKEYALIIGVIAGLGNIVPYLGPILGATPAVLVVLLSPEYASLMDKVYGVLIVGGIFVFVQLVDGIVFQPLIVGKHSKLHPLLVLLALLIGGMFGLAGLIIAIPVAAAARVIINELVWQPMKQKHAKSREQKEHTTESPPGDSSDPGDNNERE